MLYYNRKGDSMSIIFSGKEKENLCKELNINYDLPKMLIKIGKKASYYDVVKDSYTNIDLDIVSKYI